MVKTKDVKENTSEISAFKTYIEKLDGLKEEDVSLLDGLFMKLFRDASYHPPEAKNSISYPMYFEVYFRYRLSQKDLSEKDFKTAMTSGRMIEYMKYCANNNLHKELMVRLMQEDISKGRRHFEDVLRWIFSFGRTFVDKERIFRFDYSALVDKIYNYHNVITENLYKKDPSAYPIFIKSLFDAAKAPFLFENALIFHVKEKGDHFVIPMDELVNYQLSYFKQMAETNHGLSQEVLWLFWGSRQHYRIPAYEKGEGYHERWRFEPLLAERMKIYLGNKDPKFFLKFSIEHSVYGGSLTSISEQVLELFDDPSEYRQLIVNNSALDDEIKKEYLELFDKLAEKDFRQHVEMDFKTELKNRGTEE